MDLEGKQKINGNPQRAMLCGAIIHPVLSPRDNIVMYQTGTAIERIIRVFLIRHIIKGYSLE